MDKYKNREQQQVSLDQILSVTVLQTRVNMRAIACLANGHKLSAEKMQRYNHEEAIQLNHELGFKLYDIKETSDGGKT